jgi:hypothetical protein
MRGGSLESGLLFGGFLQAGGKCAGSDGDVDDQRTEHDIDDGKNHGIGDSGDSLRVTR